MINFIDDNPFSQMKLGEAPSARTWMRFLQTSLLVLGVGFLLSGIISFFAYNWDDMHHFVKMGIVAALLLAAFGLSFAVGHNQFVRQVCITAMCVLVGVFLALVGQIYQTGADSYSLFLCWGICIVAWVFIANFPPLWLIFAVISLLTSILACKQFGLPFHSQYMINAMVCLSFIYAFWLLPKAVKSMPMPKWFMVVLFILLGGICIVFDVLTAFKDLYIGALVITALACATCLIYGESKNNISIFALGFLLLLFELDTILVSVTFRHDNFFATLLQTALISLASLFAICMVVVHKKNKNKK